MAVGEWLHTVVPSAGGDPAHAGAGDDDAGGGGGFDPFASYPRAEVVAALCDVAAVLIATLDDALSDAGGDWIESAVDLAAASSVTGGADDAGGADDEERRAMRNLARDLRRGGATTADLLRVGREAEIEGAVTGLVPGLVLMTAAVGGIPAATVVTDVLARYR